MRVLTLAFILAALTLAGVDGYWAANDYVASGFYMITADVCLVLALVCLLIAQLDSEDE